MDSPILSQELTNTESNLSDQSGRVRNAVILAAGKSQRFRENGQKKPKVLMKLGGLRLLERSILTLKAAGVEKFRIVLGAYKNQIKQEMLQLPRLKGLDITYVVSEQYELGNGVSFSEGAVGFDEPFLLTMSDHIFAPETITDFVGHAVRQPDMPALACDGNLGDVFDIDDATKVDSSKGLIRNIGKEITQYDLVDTGLFYFPAFTGKKIWQKAQDGAHSVSDIIQQHIDEKGVRAIRLENARWQDVDNPSMKAEAERRLKRMLGRPEDGWVSRSINRHISTPLSFLLAKWGVSPNVITSFVLILTLIGAILAGSGIYQWIVLGAFIFQLSSILDGSDGEVARLTLRTTRFGSWYSKFSNSFRHVVFFEALGLSAYKATGSNVYLFAMMVLAALALYSLSQMAAFAWKRRNDFEENLVPEPIKSSYNSPVTDGFFNFWRGFNKPDVTALLAFLLSVAFLYQAVFWLAVLMIFTSSIKFSKSIHAESLAQSGANIFDKIDPIIFYLLGVIILAGLIFNLDLYIVSESLTVVGNKVFIIFGIALLWIVANTLCIMVLIRGKIPFLDLLYLQFVADAYNTIIPLAGLGGEPLKMKLMTNWVDWGTASNTIVTDRLIHAITGTFFTSITVLITILFVDMDPRLHFILTLVSIIVGAVGLGILWVALAGASTKISGFFLKKLKVVSEYRNDPIPVPRFFAAFSFKMLGRVFGFLELFALFSILGYSASLLDVISISGMIATSGAVFFIIPQGIGVNEAGISTAMTFLGYSAALGLTFGLVRRARMIFWAIFGVALHLGMSLFRKFAMARATSQA